MSFEKAKVLFYFDRISIMDEYENRNGRAKLGQSFRHLGCAWRGRTRVSSLDLFDGRFFLSLTFVIVATESDQIRGIRSSVLNDPSSDITACTKSVN